MRFGEGFGRSPTNMADCSATTICAGWSIFDYRAMRRFFNVERIGDSGLMRRIACLEYLAAHLGGKLAG